MKIKTNSNEIKPGDTFIAIIGKNRDGHDYIEDAIKKGAAKIIAQYGEYNIETEYVEDTKVYLENYIKDNYGEKIKKLKLIGITGTNGKTTSCFFIYQMLNKLNIPCAYIGTIGFYLQDEIITLENTTPDILELYQLLIKCVDKQIKYVAMEVSSHALDIGRVNGLEFDYAVFTNLTIDHLDYHENMENYASCKQKLFFMLKKDGIAIINNDDKKSDLMKVHHHNITYGFNKSDYQVLTFKMNSDQTVFKFAYQDKKYEVKTSILGKYNVSNLMTMIIVLNQEGIDLKNIVDKIPTLKAPPGRMDTVSYKNNTIIVDYAHTPDAVFNILNAVKEFSKGKIYSIIGCGGDRDKAKRNKMTHYSTCLSDLSILTSDNPRNEDAKSIINDMLTDIVKTNYKIVVDRKEAIKYGIDLLQENDILVILGKGHEDYQIIGDKKLYHNDKEYVLELCKRGD